MIQKIVAATGNKGKIREFKELLEPLGFEIVPISELGITLEDPEDAGTFLGNCRIKAREGSRKTGLPVIADDSGLCVDALNGAPGVYSARYAGEDGNSEANIKKLLEELKDVPWEKRTARFVCQMVLMYPDGREILSRGTCEGHIAFEKRGEGGFGYDPVMLTARNFSFAELGEEKKNLISHRGRASRKLAFKLRNITKGRFHDYFKTESRA